VYLVVVAVAWFTVTQVVGVTQAVSRTIMTQMGLVDNAIITADQFITVVFMGFLVIGIFALAIWVWQYTQRQVYFGGA